MSRKDTVFRRIAELPYGYTNSFHLFNATKNSKDFLQRLRLEVKIPAHNGCVNSICWNESGQYLLSGSDDQHLCLCHAYTHSILTYVHTGHRANIFSAKFLPVAGDNKVISCSGDGVIIYTDLEYPETSKSNKFSCHFGTAYEIITVPNDPNTFLSCGEDGTVRWFDLRIKTSCSKDKCKDDILINCHSAVSALAVNPVTPYQLAVGCSDASVRIFDRRMLGTPATGEKTKVGIQGMLANFTVPEFTSNHRITSLGYSSDGQEMLVSFSSDYVYLFDIRCSLNKAPKILRSTDEDQAANARNPLYKNRPFMKRVRVRGDWSDTGPQARPEGEGNGGAQVSSLHACLMQRMSNVLTNMYNRRTWSDQNAAQSSSSSHSGDSEMEENDAPEGATDGSGATENSTNVKLVTDHANHDDSQFGASTSHDSTKDCSKNDDDKKLFSTQNSASLNEKDSARADFCSKNIPVPSAKSLGQDILISEVGHELVENVEVPNLSLINLQQELSSVSRSLKEEETGVKTCLKRESDNTDEQIQMNLEPSSSSDTNSHYKGKIPCLQLHKYDCSLPENICDNQHMAASSSSKQVETISDIDVSLLKRVNKSNDPADVSDTSCARQSNQSETKESSTSQPSAASEVSSTSLECPLSVMMEMDPWSVQREVITSLPTHRQESQIRTPASIVNKLIEEEDDGDEDMDDESLINFIPPKIKRKYSGHRNSRTMIKESTFWGDNFVMSGSDCGHIFVWDRHTAKLAMLFEADHHVVNCLQPHPFDPILASSGIDYDIKIWAPLREEPLFDEEKAHEIVKRNEVMLEETKDTITVPASFMIRMLASLSHMTSESGWRRAVRRVRETVRERNNR